MKDFNSDFEPKQSIQVVISPSSHRNDLCHAYDASCFSKNDFKSGSNIEVRSNSTELGVSSNSIAEIQGKTKILYS